MSRWFLVIILSLFGGFSKRAEGDVIPDGHVSVRHELVFVDSPEIEKFRLVAAPMAGFSGAIEIKEQTPFPFSSKYGTRFYLYWP